MMTMQAVIGTVCIDVINVLLLHYIFYLWIERKQKKLFVFFTSILYIVLDLWIIDNKSKIMLDFLLCVFLSTGFNSELKRKVEMLSIILIIDLFCEFLTYHLLVGIFNVQSKVVGITSNDTLTYLQLIITKYLFFVLVNYVLYNQRKITASSAKIFKYISFGASLFYAFAIIASFNEVLFYHEEVGRIFVFTLVLYNVVLVIFNSYQNMHIRTVNELETMKQNRSYQGQYWKDYYKSYAEIRKIKHDLLNSYTGLYGLISHDKLDEVKLYLESSIRNLKDMERVHYFGNPLIDAIISKKVSDAREKGIDIKFHLGIINIGDIDEEDLGILLANALDNAIEANEKSKVKGIEVRVTTVNHFLKINVMNYVDDIRKVSFHKTTKTLDKENHGIGIRSMMDCVRKYSGSLIYDKKDNMVILSIVMSIR